MRRIARCCVVWLMSLALVACTSAPTAPSQGLRVEAWGISMLSPTEGWVVGNVFDDSNRQHVVGSMVSERTGVWRLVPPDQPLGHPQGLSLIRMLSANDGWAAFDGGGMAHYDGQTWRPVALNLPLISDIEMLSPDEGWAVGERVIARYTHGQWQDVTQTLPPPPAYWQAKWPYPGIRHLAIVSPTDIWAVGDGGVIWRYDGTDWRIAPSPALPTYFTGRNPNDTPQQAHAVVTLYGVQFLSPSEGWSIGGLTAFSHDFAFSDLDSGNPALTFPTPASIEHYRDGAWQVAQTFRGSYYGPQGSRGAPAFTCLSMTTARGSVDGWVGGVWVHQLPTHTEADLPPNYYGSTLLLRYHDGQWTFAAAPDVGFIYAIDTLSPDEAWAAGDKGLLHYTQGRWSLVTVTG